MSKEHDKPILENSQRPLTFADFHIHSCFSYATSKNMIIPIIVKLSQKIGLNLIGTGDILHSRWIEHLRENLVLHDDGIYGFKEGSGPLFIASGEIEDIDNIHHLFFLPDIKIAEELSKFFEKRYKIDMNKYGGRPVLPIKAEELVEIIHENSGIIGPAHAFTPFKSIFRTNKYSSLKECYGDQSMNIDFIELGLSANSQMADQILELWKYPFISNSDSHSPNPGKMGRECNVLELKNIDYRNIVSSLNQTGGNKISMNVGLDPRLGKYSSSFCFKCRRRIRYQRKSAKAYDDNFIFLDFDDYENIVQEISEKKKRCPACNGLLKLGVKDRIKTLKTTDKLNENRVKYCNIISIAEILVEVLGLKSPTSKRVQKEYEKIIKRLGSEYDILLRIPISEIKKENHVLGKTIQDMRCNKLDIVEGGGGIYGKLNLSTHLH